MAGNRLSGSLGIKRRQADLCVFWNQAVPRPHFLSTAQHLQFSDLVGIAAASIGHQQPSSSQVSGGHTEQFATDRIGESFARPVDLVQTVR